MKAKEVRCIYCGGTHTDLIENDSFICEYCGGLNYIVTSDVDFKLQLAKNNLSIYKFEDADDIYKNIIDESNNLKSTSMALMGRLLSYFGVVYVRSYGSSITTPTFSRYNPDIPSIKSSRYYKQLCNLGLDSSSLNNYLYQIDELDRVYKRMESDLSDTPEYDVFICTKISMKTNDDPYNKGYTEDSRIATDLYYSFKENGLKVFYSDKVLKGVDYDSQIYSALSKSKTILVIATCNEYLESVWVESEWRRWLNFIEIDARKKETFLLYLTDKSIEVPSVLRKVQVLDYYNIYSVIDSIINKDKVDKNKEILDEINKLKEENERRNKELESLKNERVLSNSTSGAHVHSYVTKIVEPTCSEKGYTEYKCVECGFTKKEDYKEPTGNHILEDGICKVCNKKIHSKGLKFTLQDDDTYVVTSQIGIMDSDIVIPSTYNNKKVTRIGKYAFGNKEKITSVSISENVIEIEKNAFANCINLKSIKVSDSVQRISESAFDGCLNLSNVDISENSKLSYIGNYAFSGVKCLSSIVLPKDLKCIEKYAFNGCTGLCEVYNLSKLDIKKESVENGYVGRYAINIYNSIIKDTLKIQDDLVIVKCSDTNEFHLAKCLNNPKKVIIPDYITHIKENAFTGISNLTNVLIPESVVSIGFHAFTDCISLRHIIIPKTVKQLSKDSFFNCKGIKIFSEEKYGPCKIVDDVIYSEDGTKLIEYRKLYESEFIVPTNVKEIEDYAFSKNEWLNNIVISDNVMKIGDFAFWLCKKLEKIDLPEGITIIGKDAFCGCESLVKVSLPSTLTQIKDSAFAFCVKLESINIPEGVTCIEGCAFRKCSSLKTVKLPNSIKTIGAKTFEDCGLTNIDLPNGLERIENEAFIHCISMKGISLPNSIKYIGESAFEGCNSITKVIIPNKLETIEPKTFYKCVRLAEINLSTNLKTIGNEAFYGCTNLETIDIPKNITSIGTWAFNSCINATIYFEVKKPLFGYPDVYNETAFLYCKKVYFGKKSK